MYLHLSDAHCHANFSEFADCWGLVQGISICVSACFCGDWKGLKNFKAFQVKKAYGIHPDLRVSEFDDLAFVEKGLFARLLPELQEYLISADAIGEMGLDDNISARVPMELQRRVFKAQLDLAEKFNLPVVIHCVGAWGEMLETLKIRYAGDKNLSESERVRGLVHKPFMLHASKCSAELAREFEKLGGYFSFGTRELQSKKGAACAAEVPAERLLVESDGMSSREKISETIELLAEIRNINPMDMSEITYRNFNRFYSK